MRRVLPLLGLLAVWCVLPAPAGAYHLGGRRWPGHTIRYHLAFPADAAAVRGAVKAWNASGAHVRFVATSRRRAQVDVVEMPDDFFPPVTVHGQQVPVSDDGLASVGRVPRSAVTTAPSGRYHYRGAHVWLRKVGSAPSLDTALMTAVTAHELGHVLGLQHESRRCATMNASIFESCQAPAEWDGPCHVLQRDDIAGAVKRYGGRVRFHGPEYCAKLRPPGAPLNLAATVTDAGQGTLHLTWTTPPGLSFPDGAGYNINQFTGQPNVSQYQVTGADGACPQQHGTLIEQQPARAKRDYDLAERLPPGATACYGVRLTDLFGRPGPWASVTVKIPAPPVKGPTAAIQPPYQVRAGEQTEFDDASQPGGKAITAWAWSFGDGGTSSEQEPAHTYQQPGTYTVTLQVTSQDGQTSTATLRQTVDTAGAPTVVFDEDSSTAGQPVAFEDESSPGSTPIASWAWAFGDGTTSTEENPSHTYSHPGTYTVTLTVTDQDGQHASHAEALALAG